MIIDKDNPHDDEPIDIYGSGDEDQTKLNHNKAT